MPMPVRILCGGLTNTIYAVRRYSNQPNGVIVAALNAKDDVTQEAIGAVIEHSQRCNVADCLCRRISMDGAARSERTAREAAHASR